MRSLLVVGILIVAVVMYLAATSGIDAPPTPPPGVARYAAIAEHVRSLEASRRNLMVTARLNAGTFSRPGKTHSTGGVRAAYARGYREGFGQGYLAGSYLSASSRPNAMFFPVPRLE